MAGVSIDALRDLIIGTRPKQPKRKFAETLKYTEYTGTKLFFSEAREKFGGGSSYKAQIRARAKGTFRWVGLYESTPNNQEDLMVEVETPWKHWEEKFHVDTKEQQLNGGEEQINDLMQERRSGVYESIWNGIEGVVPTSAPSSVDGKQMRGIFYWLRPLDAGTEDPIGGFNGKTIRFANGDTSTLLGGADASDAANERLRNFAATYTGEVTPVTARLIRRCMKRTKFGSLPELTGKALRMGGRRVVLMGQSRSDELEDLAQHGPDDIKGDIMSVGANGGLKLRGIPVEILDTLDDVAMNPIVGVWTKHLYGAVLADEWMRERKPVNDRGAPDVLTTKVGGTSMITCDNPRAAGWIIHEPIAA
jgi:hypothetical protein